MTIEKYMKLLAAISVTALVVLTLTAVAGFIYMVWSDIRDMG